MDNVLVKIQKLLKVPKGNINTFGGYKFRSAEDIVEAAKPLAHAEGFYIKATDELVCIGGRFYVKATAILSNDTTTWTADGYAREEESLKGQMAAQITGGASSYARKYAYNGLFAIDDAGNDPDKTNDGKTETKTESKVIPPQLGGNPIKQTPPKQKIEKSWLNPGTEQWTNAVKTLKGGATIETIKAFYNVSKANEPKLIEESKL